MLFHITLFNYETVPYIFPISVRMKKTKPNVIHMNTYTLLASENFDAKLPRLRQCICRCRPRSMQRIVPEGFHITGTANT
jgi:hypothetical protein